MEYLHKPWLLLPPKWAHDLSSLALPIYSLIYETETPKWKSFSWRGLDFQNPLGIAGGVDKNAEHLRDWWNLGCGFLEIGTVTPRPQGPNPGKIMDRDMGLQAMWNKMGFPSAGADETFFNIQAEGPKNFRTPLFINIGKNRTTPNENAVDDYLFLIKKFSPLADAFVVNISSPNTKGLRELQNKENLSLLLEPLLKEARSKSQTPVLVKLSPDMGEEALANTVVHCADLGIDGFVLTNTTLSRPTGCHFPEEGGLSGAPLKNLSRRALEIAVQSLGKKREGLLIVSAGGVQNPEDVFERLQMGADLVQIYSALIFHGPQFFLDVASRYNERK